MTILIFSHSLSLNRLDMIHRITSANEVLIALHGVDNFPDPLLQKLVVAGVSKINVNRDIMQGYYDHVENKINKIPFTQLLEEGVEIVAKSTEHLMDVVFSTDKA